MTAADGADKGAVAGAAVAAGALTASDEGLIGSAGAFAAAEGALRSAVSTGFSAV